MKIMFNIDAYKKNPLFHTIHLKAGEVLFHEGAVDRNLYLIQQGSVLIEKYTDRARTHLRVYALLKSNDVFGEGGMSNNSPKEVQVRAYENSILLAIDGKDGIQKLITETPKDGYALLLYIIEKANEKILSCNKEIAIIYEVNKAINSIEQIDLKNIFMLIDFIRLIIGCSYIIFFEHNEAMENVYTLRYDTRHRGKLQEFHLHLDGKVTKEILRKEKIYLGKENVFIRLYIGEYNLGYLVFGNNVFQFQREMVRVLEGICTSITGLLRQRNILIEERNKKYIKNNI